MYVSASSASSVTLYAGKPARMERRRPTYTRSHAGVWSHCRHSAQNEGQAEACLGLDVGHARRGGRRRVVAACRADQACRRRRRRSWVGIRSGTSLRLRADVPRFIESMWDFVKPSLAGTTSHRPGNQAAFCGGADAGGSSGAQYARAGRCGAAALWLFPQPSDPVCADGPLYM